MQGVMLDWSEDGISPSMNDWEAPREEPKPPPVEEEFFHDPLDQAALEKADFGTIGRQRAEEIVRGKPLGSFLLRDSTSHSLQKCITAKESLSANPGHQALPLEDEKSGSYLIHYLVYESQGQVSLNKNMNPHESSLLLYLRKHHPQLKFPIVNAIKADKEIKEIIQKDKEEADRKVNSQTIALKRVDLHLACYNSADLKYITKLLDFGANINQLDRSLATPLHYAVYKNNLPLVKHLLDKGATTKWKPISDDELGKAQDHIRAELSVSDKKFCLVSADYMNVLTSNFFSSVRCNVGVRGGNYYYEVTLLTDGLMQIGWSTKRCEFKSMTGVGDDKHSWAWDGFRQCIWYKSQIPHPSPPPPWKEGDVVGCYVSFEDEIEDMDVNKKSKTRKRKLEKQDGGTIYSAGTLLVDSDDESDTMECTEFGPPDEEMKEKSRSGDMEVETDTTQQQAGEGAGETRDISNKISEWWKKNMRKVYFRVEINGKDVGVEQLVELHMKDKELLYPSASIGTHQHCRFNFGQESFKYPPQPGFSAIADALEHFPENYTPEEIKTKAIEASSAAAIVQSPQMGTAKQLPLLVSPKPIKERVLSRNAGKVYFPPLPQPPQVPQVPQPQQPQLQSASIEPSLLSSEIQQFLQVHKQPIYIQPTLQSSSLSPVSGSSAPVPIAQIPSSLPQSASSISESQAERYELWPIEQSLTPDAMLVEATLPPEFTFAVPKSITYENSLSPQVESQISAEFEPQLSRVSEFLYAAHQEAQSMAMAGNMEDEKERYLRAELPLGSALHWAACLGLTDALKTLLDAYKREFPENDAYNAMKLLALKDKNESSLLHAACYYGKAQCIEIMLEELQGIECKDVFCANADGFTPAHALLFCNKTDEELVELFTLLLKNYKEHTNYILSVEDKNDNNVIEYATKNGMTKLLQFLLFDSDLARNERTKFHGRAVELAGFRGQLNTLKFLISSVVGVDEKFTKNSLLLAAAEGHKEVVDYLVSEVKVSTEVYNTPGNTPIMRAAANGHTETMKLLLEKGASLEHHDKYSNNALMLCCRKGKIDSMELILTHSPLNIHERKKNGFTAFLWACNLGFVDAARFLLDKGASVEDRDEDGNSAILLASWNGHNEMLEFLIEKGASVKDRATSGSTPLLYAAARGHIHTLPLLLKHGASLAERDESMNTPLIWACRNGHLDMADLLLHLDASLNDLNVNDNNAYLVCSAFGQLDSMKFLLANGVPLTTTNANGTTALLFAAMNGNLDVVKFLVDSGVQIDEKNNGGNTAMLLAASRGQNEVIRYLLAKGASLSDTNSRGETCLLLAIRNEKVATIRMLLNYSSCVDLKKKFLDSPPVVALAKALRQNQTVTSLDLRGNSVDDAAVLKLAKMLSKNKHLTSLNLEGNQDIGTNGLLALIDTLNSSNKSLTVLRVVKPKSKNSTNQAIQLAINDALERNKRFRAKVAAAALRLATAARVLLSHGTCRAFDCHGDHMMIEEEETPTMSACSFDFLSLPSELQELVVVSVDTEGILTAGEKRAILRYALDRATLGQTRVAFLKTCIESITYWYEPPSDYP